MKKLHLAFATLSLGLLAAGAQAALAAVSPASTDVEIDDLTKKKKVDKENQVVLYVLEATGSG